MRRVVSVWLPHWATDRLRRSGAMPSQPMMTTLHDGRRRVIGAADGAAQALGLQPGVALARATAVVSGLTVMEAKPEADAAVLHRLAVWCRRCTPLAAPDPPDGLWLDITGAAHLFGGKAALANELVPLHRGFDCLGVSGIEHGQVGVGHLDGDAPGRIGLA